MVISGFVPKRVITNCTNFIIFHIDQLEEVDQASINQSTRVLRGSTTLRRFLALKTDAINQNDGTFTITVLSKYNVWSQNAKWIHDNYYKWVDLVMAGAYKMLHQNLQSKIFFIRSKEIILFENSRVLSTNTIDWWMYIIHAYSMKCMIEQYISILMHNVCCTYVNLWRSLYHHLGGNFIRL